MPRTKSTPAKLISRLVEYARIDTQSSSASATYPSTRGQRDLAGLLTRELQAKGLEVFCDENCYVYAKLPGSVKNAPAIGFLAHLDTAEDAPGKGVAPQIHENYLEGDIVLRGGVTIPASDLESYGGDTIITSDGTTLLGGDDKAGIAVIMTAIDFLLDAGRKHGDVYILFNPDEEIGKGLDKFDPDYFPVAAAYTFDGGGRGTIEYETFNAAQAKITFRGVNAHPGQGGYQTLVNAISLASAFERSLPAVDRPECTQGRHGFYYPFRLEGSAGEATLSVLVRDFETAGLEQKKKVLLDLAVPFNTRYGPGTVAIALEDQYANMKSVVNDEPQVVEIAVKAMRKAGIAQPTFPVIRGGTDGAHLSVKWGIPTPNIATGENNIHSIKEFVAVGDMVIATQVLTEIVYGFSELER